MQSSSVILLGIVGLPGSGKSSVASGMEHLGATVINADVEGHGLLVESPIVEALVSAFGPGIRSVEGVDRTRLADAALRRRTTMKTLNAIMHPPLLKRLAGKVREAWQQRPDRPVVIDAALIPEWGIGSYFDLLVFVHCSKALRHKRLVAAGRDLAVLRRLERFQLPEVDKRNGCHVVVDNHGSRDDLMERVHALYRVILAGPAGPQGGTLPCPRKLWID